MSIRTLQLCVLVLAFIVSFGIFSAAVAYASLAQLLVANGTSGWISLLFYLGTIPLLSTVINFLHILAFHFGAIALPSATTPSTPVIGYSTRATQKTGKALMSHITIPHSFILILTSFQGLAWLAQSTISTTCELGPILQQHQGKVPGWCPQAHFHDLIDDTTADRIPNLALIATGKSITEWIMFVICLGLIECARRIWVRYPYEKDWTENEPSSDGYTYHFTPLGNNISAPGLRFDRKTMPATQVPMVARQNLKVWDPVDAYPGSPSGNSVPCQPVTLDPPRPPPPTTLPAETYHPLSTKLPTRAYEARL